MRIKSAQGTIFIIILAGWQFLFALGVFADTPTVFVNSGNTSGIESGATTAPFNTLQEGIDKLPDGGVINVAGGSYLDIFLTEDNSNISFVGGADVDVDTGFFGNGLPSKTLNNVSINGFQFTGEYSDIFLSYAESISIINSRVEDGFQGLTLINVKNSSIKNNIFSQNWANLVLAGDLSGTEIKFNDFISAEQGTQIDASELNTPDTIKLPFNWWGSAEEPSVIDKVDRNKWLVATKDEGKPNSGYSYEGDNGRVEISGGIGSTANIYVGKYSSNLEDGVSLLSGNLTDIGAYYDIVSDEGTIAWPITITINYQESELPTDLSESDLQGIYYFQDGSWKLYGTDPADDPQGCQSSIAVDTEDNNITAAVCHLTPIVVGGKHGGSTLTPILTSPTPIPTTTSAPTVLTAFSTSQTESDTNTNSDTTQIDLQAANIAEVINPILDFLEVKPETVLEEFVSEGEVLGEEVVKETASKPKEIKPFPLKELIVVAVLIGVFSYLLRRTKII